MAHLAPVTVGPATFDFRRPLVMGVVNLTPDSFSDGGAHATPAAAAAQAQALAEAGADLVDVGAESTRPGAPTVPDAEQCARLLPALAAIVRRLPTVPVSVDTSSAPVARRALDAGAHMINDVRALGDAALARLVVDRGVPVVLVHGMPAGGRHRPRPGPQVPCARVVADLQRLATPLRAAGLAPEQIWLDPGLGFHKSHAQSLALIAALPALVALGHPVVVGASRKGFVGALAGEPNPQMRDGASAALGCLSVVLGAHIIRAHDARATARAVAVGQAAAGLLVGADLGADLAPAPSPTP